MLSEENKIMNIVQNSDRLDLLTSCKITHNFYESVTLPLKFHHSVEAIFLVFRVCWEARGMALCTLFLGLKKCTTSCYSGPIWGT